MYVNDEQLSPLALVARYGRRYDYGDDISVGIALS